ncbi:hypothetical protein K490DRAFT_53295 [Saccharata proteae CBS 121410]|uniref:Uncharacterized protein n=1 Tax=Saccharata proteae CBS 121410 TaxID=1314787 RepID=A0A9P4HZH0_9PEZI|nr:hypothetical protein K490DRAFT_53295 [Saccharata proteae CBS 121410]
MASSKPLRQVASEKLHGQDSNPSQLGDPVSLKAEASDSSPTDQDRGAQGTNSRSVPNSSGGSHEEKQLKEGKKSLKEKGDVNRTMLGDPTSLKAETTERQPVDHDNGPSDEPQTKRDGSKL